MGTESSKYSDASVEWEFVGRENEMEAVSALLKEVNTVGIYGMRHIGKSRFLTTLFKKNDKNDKNDTVCLIKDFEPDDVNSAKAQYKWLATLFKSTGTPSEYEDFTKTFSGGKIICGKCEDCQNDTACRNKKAILEQAANRTVLSLESCSTPIVLYLDNVDNIMESELKEIFLNLIEKLDDDCPEVKLIFCSSRKANFANRSYGAVVLGPLSTDAIIKLIYLTTESSGCESNSDHNDDASDHDNSQNIVTMSTDELFTRDNEYFTPENRPCIEAIADLCEGLPMAAIMSGTLLSEDEGILNPTELLEILIRSRFKNLRRDHCPIEARKDINSTPMQQLDSTFREFFDYLDEVSSDQAQQDNMGKFLTIVKTAQNEKEKYLHMLLRERQYILKVLKPLSSDASSPNDTVTECVRRNLEDAGIDLEDEVLDDTKPLESKPVSVMK